MSVFLPFEVSKYIISIGIKPYKGWNSLTFMRVVSFY